MENPLISIENLTVTFKTDEGDITAVDQIDFTIEKGETVGIVGESGSGKSVTTKAIMGLIRSPGSINKASRIRFNHLDLVTLPEKGMEKVRGNKGSGAGHGHSDILDSRV
jgi:ABC-type microcin C transport system duplicated ATPase subunit YejF